MKTLKRIWNYFFGKKKVQKDFGCQPITLPPLEHCEEPQAETIIAPPQEFRDVSKQNNLIPSRFEGESFEEYKKRQALAKLFIKKKQKGEMVFVSKRKLLEKGKTFTKLK